MWKRILLYSLICGGLWLFIQNLTQIEHILEVVLASRWHWVLLGIVCQVGYFLTYAFLYQDTFGQVGVETNWQHLFPLTFTTLFVTLLAPFGGAGLALYVDDANQHDKSPFLTALGVLLGTFVFLLTFSTVLIVGLFVLQREQSLQAHEIFASSVLFVIVLGTMILLWLGARHETFMHTLFSFAFRTFNGLIKHIRPQWKLKPEWITDNEKSVRIIGTQVIEEPLSLIPSILIAFLLHSLQMTSLLCVTVAFQEGMTIGMLITSYAITMLLVMISVVPQGVGLVEGVLTYLLTSFGIQLESAVAITLVFRSISFGVPAIIGFFLLRRMKTFHTT